MKESKRPHLLYFLASAITVSVLFIIFCSAVFLVYAATSPFLRVDGICELARAQDRTTRLYYLDRSGEGEVACEIDGQELFSAQNREWVSIENVPDYVKNAFTAIEDHRFYEHKGIDIKRTLGAMSGFLSGKSSYGGSTINQQLIKNITLEDDFSVSRKVKEIVRAVKLDSALTKDEILELYLNTIYLSKNCYGIGAAAEAYFGKEIPELTLAEAASLACIPQSPTKWDPISHPENNSARRKTVLCRMRELDLISEEELENALKEDVKFTFNRTREWENGNIYSWYTESVIDESIALLTDSGIASNEQTARKLLFTGGLRIITAQDPKTQKTVEKYFERSSNFYPADMLIHPECSMVVIDPKSGGILALAGSTGKKTANRTLNYAVSTLRSPGSAIKPISVYAPAIDADLITYGTAIDDTPCSFVSNGRGGMRGWPQNYPEGYRGLTTVRDAVARSVNTVAVKTLAMVTPERSFSLLRDRLGISTLVSSSDKNGKAYTDLAPSPLALGQLTRGVSVKEMTAAYTSLANGGVFHTGKTVLKILSSDGHVLIDREDRGDRVFSEQTAAIMTRLLTGVTDHGTASAITLKSRVACAGKTGTTNADHDRWFIGYTPELLAGVWFGYPTPKSLDGFAHNPSPAVKTFDEVMTLLTDESRAKVFPDTEGVITAKYCRDSGMMLSAACLCDPRGSRVETGYFKRENAPRDYCSVHQAVLYDTVGGGIACRACKREGCRYVGLLKVERYFPYDTVIADAQYTYMPLSASAPPCLDSSRPYYYHTEGGSTCGRSAVASPFNRYCSGCFLENYYSEDDPKADGSDTS